MIHPVFSQETFSKRRLDLFEQLPDDSIVVLFAAQEVERNNDVNYPFRQNSYFWYLTGFPEPNAVAVLTRKNEKLHYTLFNAPRNPEEEIWSGKIIGQENAMADYGADVSYPIAEVNEHLPKLLADSRHIYTILGTHPHHDIRLNGFLHEAHAMTGRGGAAIEGVMDLRRIVDEMRLIKTAEEQKVLHQAGRISALGHRAAMLAAHPGKYEYSVQAALEAEFRRLEGCHWSFGSIVASGSNACCLHYHENNAILKDGDLLMVDAGAEYGGYAGDISRTIPINGKFSRNQQALYEVVLHAQKTAIDSVRVGIRHAELHRKTSILLMQGLIDLKIIDGNAEEMVDDGRVKRFYPHGTGHWLGLDVHDVGTYLTHGKSREYLAGMVITVEPGLYLQPDDIGIAEEWRGIGIRIEDDIIVTDSGADVTSADVPKEVRDIEQLLAGRE